MPLHKFHSIEEMKEEPRWLPPGDPSIVGQMRYLWSLAAALKPAVRPRGVRKYRSIEEANADRETLESTSGL